MNKPTPNRTLSKQQRHIGGLCLIALLIALLLQLWGQERLRGLSIDLLQTLALAAPAPSTQPSDVSLILIDEASYQSPALNGTPRVLWTPQFAKVIDAVMAADSTLLGMDIVLPTTAAHWTGDKTHDRRFMQTLSRYGRSQQRLLMGEVYLDTSTLTPYAGFSYAIGGAANLRPLNVYPDADGVVRSLPRAMALKTASGEPIITPSFAQELINRATGKAHSNSDPASLDGPPRVVNYDPARPIQAYSFAQLLNCANSGNKTFFEEAFKDKVVLLGLDLAVEDRVQSANRFTLSDNVIAAPDCNGNALPRSQGMFGTAGVVVMANGISNQLHGSGLSLPGPLGSYLFSSLLCLAVLFSTLKLRTWRPLLGLVGWTLTATLIAIVVRESSQLVLPLVEAVSAATLILFTALLYRNLILDRDKARIQQLFSHYLDPIVIDKMAQQEGPPKLGGETRMITIMFTDIERFSSISEETPPAEMVRFLNQYFMTFEQIIKAHNGIIERFVGDALVAMFSAPITDPDHARNGVATALEAMHALDPIGPAVLNRPVRTRFGVNSGVMTVGNVGAENRVAYTAMGDGANLAARLESANKQLGSTILVGEESYRLCADDFDWMRVNRIQVVGRETPLDVYEPLAPTGQLGADSAQRRDLYQQALVHYLVGEPDKAAELCQSPALTADATAQSLLQRCKTEGAEGIRRDGVLRLERK